MSTELEAGRELDALVAEKVMGLSVAFDQITTGVRALIGDKRPDDPWEYFIGNTNDRVPKYSTDIAAAWRVLVKMLELGWITSVSALPESSIVQWTAAFELPPLMAPHPEIIEVAATCQLAICRGALQALAHGEPESHE